MEINLIKQKLKESKIKPVQIARQLGVSPSAVHLVMAGKSTSARIQNLISESINKPVSEIWPEISTKEETA